MNNEELKTELEEIATTMVADDVVTEESGKGGFGKDVRQPDAQVPFWRHR